MLRRGVFLVLLILLFGGCRTTESGFLAQTKRLLLPDTGQAPPPAQSPVVAAPELVEPSAYLTAKRPFALYSDLSFTGGEPTPPVPVPTNVLQAQEGDSPRFRRLLEEIEAAPREQWKMPEAELEQYLAGFRTVIAMETNPEREAYFLATLRNSILPEPFKQPKQPNPPTDAGIEDDSLEDQYVVSTRKELRRKRLARELAALEAEAEAEDDDESPVPPVLKVRTGSKKARPLPRPLADNEPDTEPEDEEAAEIQASTSKPKPKYGKLTQLDGSTAGPVAPASYQSGSGAENGVVTANYRTEPTEPPGDPDDWQSPVRQGVERLRRKIARMPSERRFVDEGRLRLIELALGNRSEAARPFASIDPRFNDAWSRQMLGFSMLLDDVAIPDWNERVVGAAFRFDEGAQELARLCPMKLKNVQLVENWVTFGIFQPRADDCRAGQQVGLYMELEYPTVRHSAQGYNVRTQISYEIRDTSAKVVQKYDKLSAEETTPGRKRDYCIHVRIPLPESLPHGQYQLRVSVTDMNSENLQYAEEQIPMRVVL